MGRKVTKMSKELTETIYNDIQYIRVGVGCVIAKAEWDLVLIWWQGLAPLPKQLMLAEYGSGNNNEYYTWPQWIIKQYNKADGLKVRLMV